MNSLHLERPLAQTILGALHSVARADGVVNDAELAQLQVEARDLKVTLDSEAVFFSSVGPAELAAALAAVTADSSAGGGSTRAEIGRAFLAAAHTLAMSDGEMDEREVDLIAGYSAALALPPIQVSP